MTRQIDLSQKKFFSSIPKETTEKAEVFHKAVYRLAEKLAFLIRNPEILTEKCLFVEIPLSDIQCLIESGGKSDNKALSATAQLVKDRISGQSIENLSCKVGLFLSWEKE